MVSKASETTLNTGESALIRAIALIDVTASRTRTAGIARVHADHWHTYALGLVGHKLAQLEEGPTMQPCSLSAASSYPVPDALQIFKGNPTTGVFRRLHKLLGDTVIHIFGKALLFASKFLEAATAGLRTFALQPIAQAAVTKAHVLNGAPMVYRAIRVGSDVDDAKVNAKKIARFNLRRLFNVAGLEQVELASAVDKVTLTAQTFNQFALLFTANKRHLLATVHCPDRDGRLGEFVGHEPVIERESTVRPKRALGIAVKLVGIRDFGKDTHGNICAQAELLTHGTITQVMQGELAEGARLPCLLANVVTGSVYSFQRA